MYKVIKNQLVYRNIKNDHWLLISPKYKGVNGFLSLSDMNLICSIEKNETVSKQTALRIVNEQFRNFSDKWIFKNEQYKVNGNETDDVKLDNMQEHSFPFIWHDNNGNIHTIYYSYRIVSYQGKIYWMEINANYYPRVGLYVFESFDVEPNKFALWTSINNVKPIYKKNSNNRWEAI